MESSDYKINKVILSKSANIGDITRKGVRIKFYRNGDTFFRGFEFSFCQHNYKNLDYLLDELNRSVLCDQSILPYGIRVIFTMRGRRVREIFGLKDGESYVVSSSNSFIPLQYEEIKENPSWRNIPLPNGKANVLNYTNASSRLISPIKDRIKKKFRGSPIVSMQSQDSNQGKLIYVVRNDIGRPREIYSWLISPKTAPNIEKVLNDLSSYLAMERGCLRRLVASDGTVISSMSKLHEKSSRVLFAFGSETYKKDDLKLSKEEKENLLKVINQKVTKSNSLKTFSMNEELERTKIQHFLPGYLELSSAVAYSGHNSIIKRCFDIKRKTEGFVKAIDVRKCTVTEKTRVGNEIFLMKIAKHPSIMSTSSHFTHEFFHFLVLEKIPETSLLETVINSNHHSEKFIASVVHSCASALDYLHSNRIVLRHLTMENIMTSKVAERLDVLKICDFSLATRLKQKKKLYEICGSPYYIAPEMLMETGYDSKVDVWSLGIVIFMLFHGWLNFMVCALINTIHTISDVFINGCIIQCIT